MRMLLQLSIVTFVLLASGCQSLQSSATVSPKTRQALIDGLPLNYVE